MARPARDHRLQMVRIDLDAPIPPLRRPAPRVGFALEVRRGPRPLGFLIEAESSSDFLSAEEVQAWIEREIPKEDRDQPLAPPDAPGSMPPVTIAICTKDHPDLLGRCLTAIQAVKIHPADAPPEILVIDNASRTDATRKVAGAFPRVRYVLEEKVGLNFARNRALASAGGEIVAFIDDDAVVDPHWYLGLRQAWSRRPDAGGFSGQTLPYALDTEAQVLVERMGGFRKGFRPVVYGPASDTDPLYPCTTVFGNGCNMAFRRDLMLEIGGFDEALDTGAPLPGGGDLDGLFQVVRHGRALVYEPQMLVSHEHRRDMAGLRRQVRRSWGVGCMAFLTKVRDFDPVNGRKAERFIEWWMRDLRHRLNPLSRRRGPVPWDLVLQEYVGALIGLNGAYARSRRLTDAIRQASAEAPK